jgi:hypothetical protein
MNDNLTTNDSNEAQNPAFLVGAVMPSLFIGDIIRDIEDGDCFYEGIVVNVNPIKYKITKILWCNELDNSMNGEIIELKWWILEKLIDSKWCRLN